jgi:hypothetical protein
MSWGAQNRSKDAKTPSGPRAMSRKPKLALCGIQRYLLTSLLFSRSHPRRPLYHYNPLCSPLFALDVRYFFEEEKKMP